MNRSREKKIGIVLQYVQMVISTGISFIYTPVMLRILGQSQYGIYNLANSIISYLSLLSLGFGASYIRFYSKYNKNEDIIGIKCLNGLFLIVFLIIGTIALACGLFLSQNIPIFFNDTYTTEDLNLARILMIFMSVNLALSFPNSVFTAYVTAQEKFIFQKLLNMVKTVVGPFLTLPILLLGYGSIGMVIVTTIITIGVDITNIIYCIAKLKMQFYFKKLDFGLLREIAIFSSFIALNQIVDQINWTTDKVVLGKVCSSAAVAVYAIGSQINTYYLQFSTAISSVFVPQIHRIVSSNRGEKEINNQLTGVFTKVGRLQFIVMMLILTGFIFFGKFFVLKWAGVNYDKAYYVALLLIIPVTIPLIQNIGIEIQRAKNMHQFRSYAYLTMAIINVFISIILSKKWGELGAACGTTISLLLTNGIVMNVFYHKKIGIDIIAFWKEILKFTPALIAPICVGILLNIKEYNGLFDFSMRIFIYAIVYTISFYFVGINEFEKSQISKFFCGTKNICITRRKKSKM